MSEKHDLIEQLANLEHKRWSSWMRWMFENLTDENISRWKQQMITPYAELPEHSKESDRKEARKTMEIVGPHLATLEQQLADALDALEHSHVVVPHTMNGVASGN